MFRQARLEARGIKRSVRTDLYKVGKGQVCRPSTILTLLCANAWSRSSAHSGKWRCTNSYSRFIGRRFAELENLHFRGDAKRGQWVPSSLNCISSLTLRETRLPSRPSKTV